MDMPLNSMISARVTALFYHDLGLSLLAVMSTGVMVAGGWWVSRFLAEGDPLPAVITPLANRSRGYRWLYGGLGFLWILDGLLQLQPAMPNSAFLEMVVAPLLNGQPPWFIRLLGAGIQGWSDAPVLANLMAVWIQVGIGLILVIGRNRPWGRWGLWATLAWGLVVWIWGEGLGGLLTGSASWLSGDPGSVFFYLVSAALLLLPERRWLSGQVARGLGWGLAGFWTLGAIVQAWPGAGYWTHLSPLFQGAAENAQPAWVSGPIYQVAQWTTLHGGLANGVVTLGMLTLGLLWFGRPFGRLTGMTTGVALFLMWWLAQDFGVLGGVGTDPQTAPVLALLIGAGCLSAQPAETPRVLGARSVSQPGLKGAGGQERHGRSQESTR